MADSIFSIDRGGKLTPLQATPFDSEALLQRLVADHPEILTDVSGDPATGWVLVQKEAGVPSREGGGAQWSADHLFIDSHGIPTIVEVKRSSDTRIRREVVGQMFDYAANAVRYWPIEDLKERFTRTCVDRGVVPEAALGDLLGGLDSIDTFWDRVEDNLTAGKLRLVFVADEIPDELQTIIEFLNEQMQMTEVIGVEVKQYGGEELRALVPKVIGRTSAAKQAKGQTPRLPYHELVARASPETRAIEERLKRWAHSLKLDIGYSNAAMQVRTTEGVSLVQFYPHWESVEFYFKELFEEFPDRAASLHSSLEELAEKELTHKQPYIPCEPLLRHWDALETSVLPEYETARRELPKLRSE